jgi:hypothetical protein
MSLSDLSSELPAMALLSVSETILFDRRLVERAWVVVNRATASLRRGSRKSGWRWSRATDCRRRRADVEFRMVVMDPTTHNPTTLAEP